MAGLIGGVGDAMEGMKSLGEMPEVVQKELEKLP